MLQCSLGGPRVVVGLVGAAGGGGGGAGEGCCCQLSPQKCTAFVSSRCPACRRQTPG